jgi:hypothetical protein
MRVEQLPSTTSSKENIMTAQNSIIKDDSELKSIFGSYGSSAGSTERAAGYTARDDDADTILRKEGF